MIGFNALDNGVLQYTQNYYFGLCLLLGFFSITTFQLNSAQNHIPNCVLKMQYDGQSPFSFLIQVLKIFTDQEGSYLVVIQFLSCLMEVYKLNVVLFFCGISFVNDVSQFISCKVIQSQFWRNMHCSEKYENANIKEIMKFVLNFKIQKAYTITHEI